MSTLAACRADNFYRPPDYDPKNREKEIEKKRKEGKLKVRPQGARKIRFEMPFHVRCTSCNHMIAKGVRFNAVKKKAGRYLGTIIFQFKMLCPNCKGEMEIKTDPRNCEYLLIRGCIRYNVDYDDSKIDTLKIQTPEEGEKLNRNAFLKLESKKEDFLKAEELKPNLMRLYEEKMIMEDDFEINKTLRNQLKDQKNKAKQEAEESRKKCLDIKLLPKDQSDKMMASSVKFKATSTDNKFNIRDTIRLQSIFKPSDVSASASSNVNISELLNKKHKLDKNVQLALELANKNPRNSSKDEFAKSLSFHISSHVLLKKKQ